MFYDYLYILTNDSYFFYKHTIIAKPTIGNSDIFWEFDFNSTNTKLDIYDINDIVSVSDSN